MKNVKMILTSVVVFAVVGGAFGFKSKYNRKFCASMTKNIGCTEILRKFSSGGNNYFQDATWDGTSGNCLPNRCPDPVSLEND